MAHSGTQILRAGWALAALALGMAPSSAGACSWDCVPGKFLPASGSTIPANTPALVLRAGDGNPVGDGGSMQLHLQRMDLASGQEVAFHVVDDGEVSWLTLDEALLEGARYRLSQDGDCAAASVEFQVGKAAPLPTQLGALQLETPRTRPVDVATASGSCDTAVAAVATLTGIALESEAEPWAALLSFQVNVDGEPFRPMRSIMPQVSGTSAEFVLYAECPALYRQDMERDEDAVPDEGLTQGEHSVTLEARLPGVDDPLTTGVRQVTLTCPSKGAVTGAGVPKDDQEPELEPAPSDETADCSLHTARRGAQPLVLLAGFALGWMWRRRTRA